MVAIAQHLQSSSRVKKLKGKLKKVKDSFVVVFTTNVNLVEDNLDLKTWEN